MASCVEILSCCSGDSSQLHASTDFAQHPLGFGLRGNEGWAGLCAVCRMYRLPVTCSRSSPVQPIDKSTVTGKYKLKNREFSFQCYLMQIP
jgi:hypothetical protein